jgi:hypothetical protein
MKKFMAFYVAPMSVMQQLAQSTPEQTKAGMQAWMAWSKKNAKSVVDLGAPLGKGKRVAKSGAKNSASEITGYSILQGSSLAGITKIFTGHPHLKLPGASIEVIEVMPTPGT